MCNGRQPFPAHDLGGLALPQICWQLQGQQSRALILYMTASNLPHNLIGNVKVQWTLVDHERSNYKWPLAEALEGRSQYIASVQI